MRAEIYTFGHAHAEQQRPAERLGAGEDRFRYPAPEDPWEVSCGAEDELDRTDGDGVTETVPQRPRDY